MDFSELQQNIARLELPNIDLQITSSLEKSQIGRVLGIMLRKLVIIAIMFGINFEDVARDALYQFTPKPIKPDNTDYEMGEINHDNRSVKKTN